MEKNESRVTEAVERKRSGKYNCAQAVACTYCDLAGVDEETMRNMGNAFGTGMGSMDGTCGALVGAGMVLGMLRKDRVASMRGMKGIVENFRKCNGSVVCRELKGIGTGVPLRGCNDCVADASRFLEDAIGLHAGE